MNSSILRLAIPNIVSNISIPLVSAVDTVLMGHLSTLHLAALGIVSMVFLFLYGTMNFLRSGTTGMAAQAFGVKDKRGVSFTLYRALLVALIFAFTLLFLRDPIKEVSFYLLNIDKTLWEYASIYYDIRIATAPAVFILYAITGWLFGLQNAYYPLLITVIVNVSNIVLSYLFVVVFQWGIKGAAYGTLIAQYIGVVSALLLLLKYKVFFIAPKVATLLQKDAILRFFQVNRDIFIRTLLLTFAFAYFNAQAAKAGPDLLAVMVLLLQFVIWFSYFIDGFANAAESLIGRYYGAKDWEKFYKVLRLVFLWAIGFTLLFTLLYTLFTEDLASLYTNQKSLVDAISSYQISLAIMPLLSFTAFIWDGVFIGMTATRTMRNSVTVATILFVSVYSLTKEYFASNALWLSFLGFFLFRGVLQSYYFFRYREQLK